MRGTNRGNSFFASLVMTLLVLSLFVGVFAGYAEGQSTIADETELNTRFTVTVNDAYGSSTGAGTYSVGDTVTINAGTRSGYTFYRWTADSGITLSISARTSATTTFTMPANDVVVTASWTATATSDSENTRYTVTVNNAYGTQTGAGTYSVGDIVTINAGTPEEGFYFSYWRTNKGNVFPEQKPITTFTMPASDVIITAHWSNTQYSITYILNGGSNSNYPIGTPATYTKDKLPLAIPDPYKVQSAPLFLGYDLTFLGWTVTYADGTQEYSQKSYNIPEGTMGDIVLEANWGPNRGEEIKTYLLIIGIGVGVIVLVVIGLTMLSSLAKDGVIIWWS